MELRCIRYVVMCRKVFRKWSPIGWMTEGIRTSESYGYKELVLGKMMWLLAIQDHREIIGEPVEKAVRA